jgi:gluconate kinase
MKRSTYYLIDNQNQIIFCSKLKTEVRKFLTETKLKRNIIISNLIFNNLIVKVTQ